MTRDSAHQLRHERADRPVILVVEDEILLRMSIVADLIEAGHPIIEASNADEALAILAAGAEIDVIFSDIHMPGSIDGIGLWQAVRERYPRIPVILTSGQALPLPEHLESGLVFTSKPYSPEHVLDLVHEVIMRETQNGRADSGAESGPAG